MNLLIQDYSGHPFEIGLSRAFAKRGHHVTHVYAGYNQTPKGLLEKQSDDPESFQVLPLYTRQPLQKYSWGKRWLQEREYGALLARQIEAIRPDFVISANTPLDAQEQSLRAARKVRAGYIHWMQDAIGMATRRLLSKRLPVVGDWVGRYYQHKERQIARESDAVIAITPDFLPLLAQWEVPSGKITVIPNWAPLEELPLRPKRNAWSEAHGVADRFVYLYSGTLGLKHNPDLLLQLALCWQDQPDTMVLVISEGPGAAWLQQKKQEYRLDRLQVIGYQPMEDLPDVLASGDVLTAILEPDAGIFSVPSKVLSYLCAERPLLLAVPSDNLAARIVLEHQMGRVVDPRKPADFLEAAEALRKDPTARGVYARRARRYAEMNFQLDSIADQFESLLNYEGKR